MVRLADEVVCTQSVYNARIYTQWIAYKDLPNPPHFYRTDEGTLLSNCDGVLTIDGKLFDPAELRQFIRMCGYHTVVCAEPAAQRLGLRGDYTAATVMCYSGTQVQPTRQVETAPKLDHVFPLLQATFENMQNAVFELWYCDISLKIRRELAYVYGIYNDGNCAQNGREVPTLAATAGVYYQNPQTAVIGSVATIPEQRGRGLATEILKALIARIQSDGRLPQIVALNESAGRLYRRLGFEETEKFIEIKLHQEY